MGWPPLGTIADWASVVGTIVSIASIWVAAGARTAAREARAAVFARTVAEELSTCVRLATDVSRFALNQHELAGLRVDDLIEQASYLVTRRQDRIGARLNTVLEARAQLFVLRGVLGRPLDQAGRERIGKVCQTVVVAFQEAHGHALKADEGDK